MRYPHLVMIGALLNCSESIADPMEWIQFQIPKNWVSSISIGPVWEGSGQSQTLYLTPTIVKTYASDHNTHALVDGEFFIGLQKELPKTFLGQIGFAVAATNNAKLSGVIWDDADPNFNNYNYQYQIQHTYLAIKGKLLADRGYWFIPWLSASLGVGFNQSHDFHNTPLIPEALVMPNFSASTKTSFSYTLGAGIQKILNSHWQIGMGYEFADWGKSQLNRAATQTLNSGLNLNHLYTNGVLFNLTYLA